MGWYWAEAVDCIEKRLLYHREGRLAARIVQEGDGWWLAYPGMTPEPPVEPLDAAIKRAETVALSTAQRRRRAANRAACATPVNVSPLDMQAPAANSAGSPSGAIQSRWKPSPTLRDFSDFPDIPAFLRQSAKSTDNTLPSPPLVPQINEAPHCEPPEVAEQPNPQIGDLPGDEP
jgi:hypothetical protein